MVYAKYNCTLFAVEIVDSSVSAVQVEDALLHSGLVDSEYF